MTLLLKPAFAKLACLGLATCLLVACHRESDLPTAASPTRSAGEQAPQQNGDGAMPPGSQDIAAAGTAGPGTAGAPGDPANARRGPNWPGATASTEVGIGASPNG